MAVNVNRNARKTTNKILLYEHRSATNWNALQRSISAYATKHPLNSNLFPLRFHASAARDAHIWRGEPEPKSTTSKILCSMNRQAKDYLCDERGVGAGLRVQCIFINTTKRYDSMEIIIAELDCLFTYPVAPFALYANNMEKNHSKH